MIISGNAVVIDRDNIITDRIFPGRYMNQTVPVEIVQHVLEGVDGNLKNRIKPGAILVVGRNFGCGSSRPASKNLIDLGISCILAESVSALFYRNAINMGLPVFYQRKIRR